LPRLKLALAKARTKSLPEMAGFFLGLWDDVVVACWWVFTPLEVMPRWISNGVYFWLLRD